MSRFRKIAFSVIFLLVICGGIYIYSREKMVPMGLFTCSENELFGTFQEVIGKDVKYTYKKQEDGSFIVYIKNKEYLDYLDRQHR